MALGSLLEFLCSWFICAAAFFLLILIFYVYTKNEKFWACIAFTCVIFVFVLQKAVSLACS